MKYPKIKNAHIVRAATSETSRPRMRSRRTPRKMTPTVCGRRHGQLTEQELAAALEQTYGLTPGKLSADVAKIPLELPSSNTIWRR